MDERDDINKDINPSSEMPPKEPMPEQKEQNVAQTPESPATVPAEPSPIGESSEQVSASAPNDEKPEPAGMMPGETVAPTTADAAASKGSFFARRKWLIIGGVVLLLFAAALTYWLTRASEPAAETTKNSVAQVAQLGVAPTLTDGTVEYSSDGNNWEPLTDKIVLTSGDRVRTAADGRVVLTLDDGSAVRLGYSSSVKLTSLDAKDVQIENLSGEVYSRVVPSDTRTYTVAVEGVDMVAKGTAFRTMAEEQEKGVEVYQSTVQVKETDVTEGKAYFTESSDAAKKDTVSDIDLNAIKSDEFIKWNVDLDSKMTEAKDKLGVLADFNKPVETPKSTTTQTQPKGIVLSGKLSGYTAKLTWTVNGVDTSKGFKLVRSTSTKTPKYPGDDAQYVSKSSARSAGWDLKDAKTYYLRICAYRGDSCDSYSNTITLKSPGKTVEELQHGSVTASLSGTTLSWTSTGTAPNGFKVVRNTSGSPEYPGSDYLYLSSSSASSADITKLNLESGTNYIRVCKYTGGSCTDYSNQVTYVKP